MQYKVPQNIDIEDKVIGPLTLRQFTILLVATGIIMVLYFMFQGPTKFIFYFLSLIVGAGALSVAFMKYGDQNFEIFMLSAVKTFFNPRERVWRKETLHETPKIIPEKTIQKGTTQIKKKNVDELKNDLQRLAEVVDTGGVLAIEGKDRILPFETGSPIADNETPDILQKKSSSNILDKVIEASKNLAPKREPLVSEMTKPAQKYEYSQIRLKK